MKSIKYTLSMIILGCYTFSVPKNWRKFSHSHNTINFLFFIFENKCPKINCGFRNNYKSLHDSQFSFPCSNNNRMYQLA